MNQRIPKAALAAFKAIKGKRSRIVVKHILKHGSITTEELSEDYGYDHPPRAIRDVKDQGIPIEKKMVRSKSGRRMAQYYFGDLSKLRPGRIGGRGTFSKQFKKSLAERQRSRCACCGGKFEDRYLQIDHRVPYVVAGDGASTTRSKQDFMLLCGSCNRAKSWSCEHCKNWKVDKDEAVCKACYWGNPLVYSHIALRDIRRLDLIWAEGEVSEYTAASRHAKSKRLNMPAYVKAAIRRVVRDR